MHEGQNTSRAVSERGDLSQVICIEQEACYVGECSLDDGVLGPCEVENTFELAKLSFSLYHRWGSFMSVGILVLITIPSFL